MRKKLYVNEEKLDEYIKNSGLRTSYITDKLGISREAFYQKKRGNISFRVSEVYVLCDLLKITDPVEKTKIFYPKSKDIAEPATERATA